MQQHIKTEVVEAQEVKMPEQPQATDLWTIDEVGVELLSDLGDLLIEAGSATKQAVAHFKVSQAVLSHASLVWRIMLSRTNLKAIKIESWARDYTLRLLELPEDDAEGLRTLLQIAHLQFNLVPVEISARHLSSISRICYRYETHGLVVEYIERWLKDTRDYIRSGDCKPDEDLIWTVWVFDRTRSLRTVTAKVMKYATIEEFSAWTLPEIYQVHVLRNMQARNEAIISRVYELLEIEPCAEVLSAVDSEEKLAQKHECGARRLGFVLQTIGYGLKLPLQDRPDHAALQGKSLEDIMHTIEDLEWLALRKIDGSVHAKCAAEITNLHKDLQKMCVSLDDVDEELSNLVRVES